MLKTFEVKRAALRSGWCKIRFATSIFCDMTAQFVKRRDFRYGVQLGSGRVRTGCPFYPQEPTSSDRPGMISDNAQSHILFERGDRAPEPRQPEE